MSSLKDKSIKGFLWDFSGRIGLQGVGFIVSIVLARLLAPEEFGLLAIITVFINLASVFLDFGFSTALIQRQDIKEEHYSAVFYLNVVMGFVLATIVFLLAPLIGRFYSNEVLANVTRLMAVGILISSFGNVMRARLRRVMDFKSMSLASIYAAIISGLLAMYLAFKGYGVWSLAVQSVVNQLLANVFLYFFCKHKIRFKLNLLALIDLWPFSSRIFFSGLLDTIFLNIDALIIGKLINPATLGYYQRAKSLEYFGFRYTASTLSSVLLPGLSSLQDDHVKLRQVVLNIFQLLLFVSFLGSGLLLVGGREFIIILFSAKWEPSVTYFQILIAGAFASQVFSLFYNVLLSTGNVKKYLLINIISKGLLFINFGVLLLFGLNSYLVGFVIIQILTYFFGLWMVSKQLSFHFELIEIFLPHLLIFVLSTTIVFGLKVLCDINNLYLSLSFALIVFIFLFLGFSRLLNESGLRITYKEIVLQIKKIQNG